MTAYPKTYPPSKFKSPRIFLTVKKGSTGLLCIQPKTRANKWWLKQVMKLKGIGDGAPYHLLFLTPHKASEFFYYKVHDDYVDRMLNYSHSFQMRVTRTHVLELYKTFYNALTPRPLFIEGR